IMKQHTTKGGSILRPVASLKEMIPGIEGHHESLDGRGYPYGLKGDQLPLMPRVIMVADTFDAMTTNRPYQAAMDPEYVVRIINSLATTTDEVLQKLRDKADRKQIGDVQELKRLLKAELLTILTAANSRPPNAVDGGPEVIMVVGVNGTGKTTSIGKLANLLKNDGKSVMLCAADTFRAAAIEQLEIWGERTQSDVIKTKPGGDPAAVLFDALEAAKARKSDYVIV